MDCERFLERYSDFVDGLLDEARISECESHLEECPACARYSHVVDTGLRIFRDLPEAEPARDFAGRLRHRLYHVEDSIPWATRHPGGSAALFAVAAVGLLSLFWLPFATQMPVEVEFAPVAVAVPQSPAAAALFRGGPFFDTPRTTPLFHRSLMTAPGGLHLPATSGNPSSSEPQPAHSRH